MNAFAERHSGQGHTVMLVAVDGKVAGLVAVADPVTPTTPQAIRDLQSEDLQIVILRGDSAPTARDLGIGKVYAEVLAGAQSAEPPFRICL